MKAVIVITLEVPEPEQLADALLAIDPPSIPHFTGTVRVTVEPWASALEEFLDRSD